MSTVFGVKNPRYTEGEDEPEEEFLEVAKRGGGIYWVNELAQLLPDDMPVYPLDNSAQGIFTIGDIKKAISHESRR